MKTELQAKVSLISGMHFTGRNPDGLGAEMDSKPLGEPGIGATPMELVLQAAGGCSGMDVAAILRKRKIDIEHLEINLTGIKREEHPRIYENITVTYRAKGNNLTLDELTRAANLSMNTYCSVFGMLKQVAEVTWECELIE